jgi:hypothetical protein
MKATGRAMERENAPLMDVYWEEAKKQGETAEN